MRTLLVALTVAVCMNGQPAKSKLTEVDHIFAAFNTHTPGCAVGVSEHGTVALRAGYGMADLERGVPVNADTVFESGSVAKQFTAMAILLLAQQGKISLDDPMRKYLPELPDFGAPLTIRHVLSHLSGLREWRLVATFSGTPEGTYILDNQDLLRIASRQRALNFDPGTAYSYTNTGFNIATILIERALNNGTTFQEFTREAIFEPLKMTHTRWRDDFRAVVPNRALAYGLRAGGWIQDTPVENIIGAGGMLSTVGDWLLWNENFTHTKVGGPEIVKMQQTPATLAGGKTITYAAGLTIGTFDGFREVSHGGSTGGYRTWIGRYPEKGVSVAVMCNSAQANPTQLGRETARLWTGGVPAPNPSPAVVDPAALEKLTGMYRKVRDNTVAELSATFQEATGTANPNQIYCYDAFGNRLVQGWTPYSAQTPQTSSCSSSPNFAVFTNNQWAPTTGVSYDAAGNQTGISGTSRTFTYDAENRQAAAAIGSTTTTYSYDGDGRRVQKAITGGATTTYVYDAQGLLTAEYGGSPSSVSGTTYLTGDHLGSTRLVSNCGTGTSCTPTAQERYDYAPFGEELTQGIDGRNAPYSTNSYPTATLDAVTEKFTSKERDSETGLDYFGARYMSSAQGRFTSPDVAGPDLTNPQTLNKYRYALNNPLRYVDRNGLYEEDVHRDLTTVLAMAVGFSNDQATRIGQATQHVDDDPATNPITFNTKVRADFHFTSAARRDQLWNTFNASGTINELGTYLHAEEDSFSHADQIAAGRTEHIREGTAPDKTYNNPDRADKMAKDTYDKLIVAASRLGAANGQISWDKISGLVDKFNRANNNGDKQKLLDQIRSEITKQRDAQKKQPEMK